MMKRNELAFQGHIIDSYKYFGGYAKKWASELQKGVPDLIATTREHGLHLAEVKHRPEFGKVSINNPLESKQQLVCREYIEGGSRVFGFLVSGEKAVKSRLYIFDPLCEKLDPKELKWVPYVIGLKFDVVGLINSFIDQ